MRKELIEKAREFLNLCKQEHPTELIIKADRGCDGDYETLSEAFNVFFNAYVQTPQDTDPTAEERYLKWHLERVFNILHAVWATDVGKYARIEFGYAIDHRLEQLDEFLKAC